MKILNKLLYRFSNDYCFDRMIEDGNVTKNKRCGGKVGGDETTGFLSCNCYDCKYFDNDLLRWLELMGSNAKK